MYIYGMKSSTAYLFAFLYLLAMFRPVAPVFDYIINQDYIEEFFCVNKDSPELECKGKCYLMQMLTEQNSEKKENLPGIAMEEYPIGFVTLFSISPKSFPALTNLQQISYHNLYSYLYSFSEFHPPTV